MVATEQLLFPHRLFLNIILPKAIHYIKPADILRQQLKNNHKILKENGTKRLLYRGNYLTQATISITWRQQ